jgi:hypothetical protein
LAPGDLSTRAAERLICRYIESVGALDQLLLLHGGRARDWSIEELCRTLRCPGAWAEEQLARLHEAGLVDDLGEAATGTRAAGRQYGTAVDEIARACRRDRAAVTRLVFARAPGGRRQFAR